MLITLTNQPWIHKYKIVLLFFKSVQVMSDYTDSALLDMS